MLQLFEEDDDTHAVVLIGEIGGRTEVDAARWIEDNMSKPVVGFIAGASAPKGKRMGHAGAIISGGEDTAEAKFSILEECGCPRGTLTCSNWRKSQRSSGQIKKEENMEKTLSIIKPNAVLGKNIGNIIARFEEEGLSIVACRMHHLSRERAEGFYIEHQNRPFFGELVAFMTSAPVVLMVLEGRMRWRKIGRSWGPPTQKRRNREPSANCMQKMWGRMPSTDPIRWRLPRERYSTFSTTTRYSLRPNDRPS